MTVVPFPDRRSGTPAFGAAERAGWGRAVLRLAPLVVLLVAALAVRGSGVLRPSDPALPPLPAAAAVAPGLVRGGPPQEIDLVHLRDEYRVRAVVGVDGMDIDEQAVARGLGLRVLALHVPAGGAPSADDLLALTRFLHGTTPADAAYLHDGTGHGPVVVTAAALRLLRGVPLATVLHDLSRDEIAHLSVDQLLVLREVAAVVAGQAPPTSRYAGLRGVTW